MIPSQVVKLRRFTTSCGVYLVSYAALTGVYFYLTLLYQDVDGWTALRTGLSWLFMNVPFLVVAQFAGRLSRRLSARAIVAGGCLVTAAGVFIFSTLTPSSPFVIAVIGYVLFGTGTGMWIPGVANVAMRDVPPGLSGTASGYSMRPVKWAPLSVSRSSVSSKQTPQRPRGGVTSLISRAQPGRRRPGKLTTLPVPESAW